VPNPTFSQPARSNLLAPVLIAFLVLGITITLVLRFTPRKTADLAITRTVVYPTHTVFKADSLLVGHDRAQDDLYVLTTLHIDDRLRLPLFLKDFTGTLTTADGQDITTSAAEKQEIPALYLTYPALKSLGANPLLRDTLIDPGQSAEGMVLLHFPVTLDDWKRRKSAVLNIDLYHQGQQSVTIEPSTEIHPPATPDPNQASK
jgi:hypothetical protein